MKWPTTQGEHAYMRIRQRENKQRAQRNPNEQWMASHLRTTGKKWTPQAQWGYRIFDFWNASLGVAVEVDGKTHDPEYDEYRDTQNFLKSGILVIRVRNKNEEDAQRALEEIKAASSWNERRVSLGLKTVKGGGEGR